MSLHDTLIFGYKAIRGALGEVVNRSVLEFVGATVEDDPVNKRTKVTIAIPGLPSGVANQLLQHSGTAWTAVSGIDAARITSGGLVAARGGTGYSGYNVGDLLFASGPAALGTRAIGAEGSLFAVSGGLPNWVAGISTDKLTSGTLSAARGGTAQSTWAKGDLLYASDANTLAKLSAAGISDEQTLTMVSGLPAWRRAVRLYEDMSGAALTMSTPDYHYAPEGEDVMAVTRDGGLAVRMTNKTGAASVKGTVLKLDDTWRVTGETVSGQLSNPSFAGADWDHSDGGRLYLTVTIPGGDATVSAYKDAARTSKVAEGTIIGVGGNAGGTITLAEVGGSGVTGTITIVASAVQDLTPQANQGSDNGVMLCSPTTAGAPFAGIMYSDGVPDGSDVWVVVYGLAYVLTKANLAMYPVPAGAYLFLPNNESAVDYGKAVWEPARTAGGYDAHGIGRSVKRIATGFLMLAEIDFVGVGPTS